MGTRWTPLAVLIAVAAAVLAGAGVVAVAAHEDDDDRPAVEALGGDEVTTTITLPPTTTSTTAAPPETTTTSPPTTTGRTTTTRRTATTARPTTTARPGATTTTTPTGTRTLCMAEQIEVSGRPERLDYPAGQPVTLRTTIRNRSSSPCTYRGYSVTMTFLTLAGSPIIGSSVVSDDIEDQTFAPGQSITHTATWDPRNCPTPPCTMPAPGIYSTESVWSFSGGRYSATQDFVVR